MNHGIRRFITAALAVSAALAVAGCETRSADEVEALRTELTRLVDDAPLPPGAQLQHADAEFDEGCASLAESKCGRSGSGSYASYSVPVQLPDAAPEDNAGRCRLLVDELGDRGLALVTEWHGTVAFHPEPAGRYHHDRDEPPLWDDGKPHMRQLTVDDAACDTGNVLSAAVVRRDGTDPLKTVDWYVSWRNDEGEPGLRYTVGVDVQDDRPSKRLYISDEPLTKSQRTYLGATLDTEFVIAADPPRDGIDGIVGDEHTWTVPDGLRALRFRVQCPRGDVVTIRAYEATDSTSARGEEARCTGEPSDVELPAFPSTKLEMWHDGKGEGPMVVEFVPAKRS